MIPIADFHRLPSKLTHLRAFWPNCGRNAGTSVELLEVPWYDETVVPEAAAISGRERIGLVGLLAWATSF